MPTRYSDFLLYLFTYVRGVERGVGGGYPGVDCWAQGGVIHTHIAEKVSLKIRACSNIGAFSLKQLYTDADSNALGSRGHLFRERRRYTDSVVHALFSP